MKEAIKKSDVLIFKRPDTDQAPKGPGGKDAPVARTREAAEKGTLAVMVGGTEQVYKRIKPVLAHLAEKCRPFAPPLAVCCGGHLLSYQLLVPRPPGPPGGNADALDAVCNRRR